MLARLGAIRVIKSQVAVMWVVTPRSDMAGQECFEGPGRRQGEVPSSSQRTKRLDL